MKSIFVFIIFVIKTRVCLSRLTREECTLARDEFDLCGRELLVLGDTSQSFPETLQSIDSGFCRLINESLNCVQSYSNNCLKSFSKNHLNLMLNEIKNILINFCSINSEMNSKQQLVSSAKCLNARSIDLHECMDSFTLDLESIRDSIQNKNLLKPYSCCKFQTMSRCMSRIVNTCGQTSEQLIIDLLKPIHLTICSDIESQQYKCEQLESLDKKTDITERSLSPLIPLVDIWNQLSPIDPCVSAREKVDDCSTRLLVFGDREQRFASTQQQLDRHSCPLLNNSIQCLHSFDTKCVTRVDTTVHSIIESLISGAKREFNERCVSGANTGGASVSVFRASTCLNRALDSMHSCYDKYVAELESIRDQTDDKHLQVMYTCCRFHAMQQCVTRNAKQTCEHVTPDAIEYVTRVINNIAREFLVNTCSEFWAGSATCDALDPLDIDSDQEEGDDNGKKNGLPKTYSSYAQSFVRPLIDMFIISSENI